MDRDHYEVCSYLREGNDLNLIRLGGALGLNYTNLERMKALPEEMVAAWLREEDNVEENSGEPTWSSLVQALKKIGQNGIAKKIEAGMSKLIR